MDGIELLKTVGSATGVAALITAVFNYMSLRAQHRRLLEIEDIKKSSALETFRYTKFYEALAEIQGWPSVCYDLLDMERVVTETRERYVKVKAISMRMRPLMEPDSMDYTTILDGGRRNSRSANSGAYICSG